MYAIRAFGNFEKAGAKALQAEKAAAAAAKAAQAERAAAAAQKALQAEKAAATAAKAAQAERAAATVARAESSGMTATAATERASISSAAKKPSSGIISKIAKNKKAIAGVVVGGAGVGAFFGAGGWNDLVDSKGNIFKAGGHFISRNAQEFISPIIPQQLKDMGNAVVHVFTKYTKWILIALFTLVVLYFVRAIAFTKSAINGASSSPLSSSTESALGMRTSASPSSLNNIGGGNNGGGGGGTSVNAAVL